MMLTAFIWDFHETQQITLDVVYATFWLSGLLFILVTFRRLTEQQQKQQNIYRALINSEARKDEIMNSTLDCIISIDQQGRIMEFNRAAEKTFGYLREHLIGKLMVDTIVPANLREQYSTGLMHQSSVDNELIFSKRTESTGMRSDDTTFPMEIAITSNKTDQEIFFTAFIRDITESKQLHAQLLHQTRHDRLTGLINRYEFENILNHLLKSIKDDEHHALIYLDLDQFKVVNDNCGHGAGDCLLQELANILHSTVTKGDTFARLGGDEFGLILTHQSIEEATQVAQQLLSEIGQYRFSWEEMIFTVGASMGVVSIDKDTLTLRDVLGNADALCYQAKEEGRNRICVYNADDAVLAKRRGQINLISKIHDAFENNRFLLYKQKIQPIPENRNFLLEHFEILLRLKTTDESGKEIVVSAFSYLKAAERYDLISTIDRWVINTLFDWFENNPEKVKKLGLCSVNISGPSFSNSMFLSFLVEQLNSRDIPAHKLCFEITETAAVSSMGSATTFIKKLRSLGCQFALDDFGSGMSSFGYLKNLPVDYLKIDGKFVKDIVTDKIDQAMVKSINDVGHVLDKKTIAEFVENDDILTILNDFGVDYAQGYGIEKPVPLEGK
jgi:diguanylate cyclase (GGDEF)-like protein/PAS domain S-box-containing protein